jgi:hypothetical protein
VNPPDHYYLQDGEPVPAHVWRDGQIDEAALIAWARWFESTDNRRVAWTRVGRAYVSTVFLGFDHSFFGRGLPILFETMVHWPGAGWDEQQHYATLDQAVAGHEQMVAYVRARWWRAWAPAWAWKIMRWFV